MGRRGKAARMAAGAAGAPGKQLDNCEDQAADRTEAIDTSDPVAYPQEYLLQLEGSTAFCRVLQLLGSGAFADVQLAHSLEMFGLAPVALKTASSAKGVGLLHHEAAIMQPLGDHPNIVKMKGMGEDC